MKDVVITAILSVAMLSSITWPFIYLKIKGSRNYFIFYSSIVGVVFITNILLAVATAPIALLLIKIVPQLAVEGLLTNVLFLLHLCQFVQDWYFIVLWPALFIVLPSQLYKRYKCFA